MFTKFFWTLHFSSWCIPFAFSPLSSERDLTWKHLWILGEGSAFFTPLSDSKSLVIFFLLDPSTFAAFCVLHKKQNIKRGLLRIGKLDFNQKNGVLLQLSLLAAECFSTAVFWAQMDPQRASLAVEIRLGAIDSCTTANLKKR